jgi:hypothetical protein
VVVAGHTDQFGARTDGGREGWMSEIKVPRPRSVILSVFFGTGYAVSHWGQLMAGVSDEAFRGMGVRTELVTAISPLLVNGIQILAHSEVGKR